MAFRMRRRSDYIELPHAVYYVTKKMRPSNKANFISWNNSYHTYFCIVHRNLTHKTLLRAALQNAPNFGKYHNVPNHISTPRLFGEKTFCNNLGQFTNSNSEQFYLHSFQITYCQLSGNKLAQ